MEQDNSKFKQKVEKEMPTFTESVNGLTVTELEKTLLTYAKHREETQLALKNDKQLNDTKELIKELQGPYKDAENALKKKLTYLHILIKEKQEGLDGKKDKKES